ncbi:Hypothetical protein SRAE_2000406800 [Strongyloides ratti]|uniref:Uncharacterized protein n=1 Tax=Strongyloides ratti TaxID=34506 RepID=A0A090MZS0_STRRB|nr:Hypothetical protein SRAE_2000406800 [Strongyloides ratti]CEF69419.1 Hypothetical protein SRAE_2000406800 [Strongyloides ratti]
MQSKFMLFVFLTLLFATYSECLKCNMYVKVKSSAGFATMGGNNEKITCERGQKCALFTFEDFKTKEGFVVASCVDEENCEGVQNGKKEKVDSDEFFAEMSRRNRQMMIPPKKTTYEVSGKCCKKNFCNNPNKSNDDDEDNSSSTKMARYFLGLALPIIFLNVFL